MTLRQFIKGFRILTEAAARSPARIWSGAHGRAFPGSAKYWEQRYAQQGNSGVGSYGKLAEFKANVINEFVQTHAIDFVIEYGCGDGNQLKLATYPRYLGFDVSETALRACRELFKGDRSKAFKATHQFSNESAPLTLSLDVIYHLVEDEVFRAYMRRLFSSSHSYVIIYSNNTDDNSNNSVPHVRNRKFTDWIDGELTDWRLIKHIPNKYPYRSPTEGSFADFYIFQRA